MVYFRLVGFKNLIYEHFAEAVGKEGRFWSYK